MTQPALQIEEIERALAAELLRIHEEAYGRGAGSSRVHYLQDTVICLMDELELLPNEVFLIGERHGDGVVKSAAGISKPSKPPTGPRSNAPPADAWSRSPAPRNSTPTG